MPSDGRFALPQDHANRRLACFQEGAWTRRTERTASGVRGGSCLRIRELLELPEVWGADPRGSLTLRARNSAPLRPRPSLLVRRLRWRDLGRRGHGSDGGYGSGAATCASATWTYSSSTRAIPGPCAASISTGTKPGHAAGIESAPGRAFPHRGHRLRLARSTPSAHFPSRPRSPLAAPRGPPAPRRPGARA